VTGVQTCALPIIKDYEEVPVATDVEVKNVKNKIDARQGHTGLVTIRYGVGIDELRTMMNVAEAYDIVIHTKNARKQDVYTYKSPSTGAVIEAIGIEKFRLALSRNKEAFKEMMDACRDRIVQGFKAIDDEQLAQLAEDAVTKRMDTDDDYIDDGDEVAVVEEELDEASDGPSIDASDI